MSRIELAEDGVQWETSLGSSEHNNVFSASLEADIFLAS
jgi:hypothetical protein